MEPSRVPRNKVHTDAIFGQLMEAHINSKREKGDGGDDPSSSQMLTLENFGARTGLNWPKDRVAREIVGLVGGFTQEQQDKLTQMRNNGRAVAETLASTKEFNGRGHPDRFPYKSKQQIAAKILDLFGYVKLKSIVPARGGATASSGRRGTSSSSSKVYVYQDGGGTATLEPAAAGAARAAPTSSAAEGSNILHKISDAAYVPAASGYSPPSPYSVGRRYYRNEEAATSSAWDGLAPARSLRFSTPTTRTDSQPRFSKHGTTMSSAGGSGGGGGGGICGFEEANHHGACDDMMDAVDAVGFFLAHGANDRGENGNGNGMDGGRHPSRAGGGYAALADCPYPPSLSTPKPSCTPTRAHPWFMNSSVARDRYQGQPDVSDYTMDEPAWNGDMKKSAGFPGWFAPQPSPSDRLAMQEGTAISSTLLPPDMRGPTTNSVPLSVCNRFANGRSTLHLPPPPPPPTGAQPCDCYLPPSDCFRKKPRFPLTTVTGVAMRPPPSVDGPTSAFEASGASLDPLFSRTSDQRSGTAAQGAIGSFGKGQSEAARAAACSAADGSSTEKQPQLLKSFPASVSLADQRSLRLAFGSALAEEAWLLGTSTLLGPELNLD